MSIGIAALMAKCQELFDKVTVIIDSFHSWRNSVQALGQIITVGPDKDFPDLKTAWDSLKGRVLTGAITIKLDDGIYNHSSINFDNQPYSDLIYIEGNVNSPQNVVINMVNDTNGSSHGLIINNGAHTVRFSGFTLQGDTTTLRGLYLAYGAVFWSLANSVIIKDCQRGVECYKNGVVESHGIRIIGCRDGVNSNGYVEIPNAVITGKAKGTGKGLEAIDGGRIFATSSTISNFFQGAISFAESNLRLEAMSMQNCDEGVRVEASIAILTGSTTVLSGCDNAIIADGGGKVYANAIRVENCVGAGYVGYRNSYITASGATAQNCGTGFHAEQGTFIHAVGSIVAGNTTDYNLASGVPGSLNAIINY